MPEDNGGGGARVMHGYIREHILMTPREHADLVARFVAYAEREGYQLGKVYTEKVESVPEAFAALVQAVLDDRAVAVAVPSIRHFDVLRLPQWIRADLERAIGAPVVETGSTP
jgi:hypothetical protein